MENTTVISKEKGNYIMTETYKDGSVGTKFLEKEGNIYKYENKFGEYLKVEKDGSLGFYDNQGEIDILKEIK